MQIQRRLRNQCRLRRERSFNLHLYSLTGRLWIGAAVWPRGVCDNGDSRRAAIYVVLHCGRVGHASAGGSMDRSVARCFLRQTRNRVVPPDRLAEFDYEEEDGEHYDGGKRELYRSSSSLAPKDDEAGCHCTRMLVVRVSGTLSGMPGYDTVVLNGFDTDTLIVITR